MRKIYEKKMEYGMCDTKALLKLPEIFKMVESGVASFLGLYQKDNLSMKRIYGALWLFTKTIVQIDELPFWDDIVEIEACRVGEPSKITCIIEVFIHSKNASKGIHAWVECCAANIETRKLLRLQSFDFEIPIETATAPVYTKWSKELEEERKMVVLSSYIDFSRHVNNAEYLRIIFEGYSIEELEQMKIKNMEIHYLAESKEKDTLSILKKKEDKTMYFQVYRDKPILELKMEEE